MKIVLVCPYAWDLPGGVQSHVRSLASALAVRGHGVTVVAPAYKEASVENADPATSYRLEIVGGAFPVPANGSLAPIAFGPRVATRMSKLLTDVAPDVVHVHEPLIPSLSLLALSADRPIVGTFHAARSASAGYRAASPWLRRKAERIDRRTAVSDAARTLAARYFPGDYVLTPNGVDVRRFTAARPLDLGHPKTVLFVGRVERRKGLETLIQSAAMLGDRDVRLVVVGQGPRLKQARALAARLGVDSVWLGRLSDDDLARVYRGADVYCAPNLGGESFGIVLLEALAAGTPVVCSDLDAFRAVAGDAATYAPPGNAHVLAARLREALQAGPHVAARVERGRDRVAAFDWRRLTRDLERIYEGAAGR